ncbi:MAG: hypothetical protein AAB263_15435 [Planctomycetota bacterium]
MLGNALRVSLLLGWLAFTGYHVARHILPDLGLAPQRDPQTVLAANLGNTYHYALTWQPDASKPAIPVGTAYMASATDDVGIKLTTVMKIRDAAFVPGYKLLRLWIGGLGKTIDLRIEEDLDASLRLHAMSVSGQIFGKTFTAEGPVDHRGLTVRWKAGSDAGTTVLPDVKPDRVGGSDFMSNLPSGLNPGDRFSYPISTLDPMHMRLAVKEAVFHVLARAPGKTAAGPAELCEVELHVDGRRSARIWCDDRGLIHHQRIIDLGLELHLTGIDDSLGAPVWPPARVPSATTAELTPR